MYNCLQKIKAHFSPKLLVFMTIFMLICINAQAATYYWTGTAGDGLWITATNWNTAANGSGSAAPVGGPSTGDTVQLQGNENITLSGNASIQYLFIFSETRTSTINLGGYTLNVTSRIRLGQNVTGHLILNNGTVRTAEFDTEDNGINSLELNDISFYVTSKLLLNGTGTTTVSGGAGTSNTFNIASNITFYDDSAGVITFGSNVTVNSSVTVWNGKTSTDWTDNANWAFGVPSASSRVIIAKVTNPNKTPVLASATESLSEVTIVKGAKLALDTGANLQATTITNNGELTIKAGTITGTTLSNGTEADSTVVYDGATTPVWNTTYNNLKITSGSITFTDDITVNKTFTINSAFTNNAEITVKGDVTSTANMTGTGKINFAGTAEQTFAGGGKNYSNIEINNSVIITGNNTFTSLTANAGGKTITFGATTQNVTGSLTLKGSGTGTANLLNLTGSGWELNCTGTSDIQYTNIDHSTATQPLVAVSSVDGGYNVNWSFPGNTYTWTGATDDNWFDPGNWDKQSVPGLGAQVIIDTANPAKLNNNVTLSDATYIGKITIKSGAIFDIAGQNVILGTGDFINNGRLRLQGVSSQSITGTMSNGTSASSVVEYYGGSSTDFIWNSNQYKNLEFTGGAATSATLTVTGTVTIAAGSDTVSFSADGSVTIADNAQAGNLSITCPVINLTKVTTSGTQSYTGSVNGGAIEIANGGTCTFNDNVTATSLSLSGDVAINCASITTTGAQTYDGQITFAAAGGATTLTAKNGATYNTITIKNSINGSYTPVFDSNVAAILAGGMSVNTSLEIKGNFSDTGIWASAGGKKLILSGTANQTFTAGTSTYPNIELSKPSGKTVTFEGNPTITNITEDSNAGNIIFNSPVTIQSDTTFATAGSLSFKDATFELSGTKKSISHTNGNTITNGTIDASNIEFDTVSLAGTTSLQASGAAILNGNVSVSGGAGVSLTIDGAAVINCAGITTSGTTTFKGGNVSSTNSSAPVINGDLEIGTSAAGITVGIPLTAKGNVTFKGSNTFASFTATGLGGKTFTFEGGKTQTINGTLQLSGSSTSSRLTLCDDGSGTWYIDCTDPVISFVDVINSTSTREITATESTDSGNNVRWNFPGFEYTWTGGAGSNNWNAAGNWSPQSIPGKGSKVKIPVLAGASPVYPVLQEPLNLLQNNKGTITVEGTFDLAGYTLTVHQIINKGLVRFTGAANQIDGTRTNETNSTVEYYGTGTLNSTTLAWGTNYSNLIISKAAALDDTALIVSGTTKIAAGTGKTVTLDNSGNRFAGHVTIGDAAAETPVKAGAVTLNGTGTAGTAIYLEDSIFADSLTIKSNVQGADPDFTGDVTINAARVTSTGDQTYNNTVTLQSDVIITGGNGKLITFGDTVSASGAESLTIAAATVTFNASVTVGTLQTQKANIYTASIETTANGQTYNDEVKLEAGTTLTVPADKNITFEKTVTGDYDLITTQTVIFKGQVTVGTLQTQKATIYTASIETTVNGQTYNDEVTLGAAATLKVPDTKSIVFVKTVTGDYTLTTNQTVTFNDKVKVGTLVTQKANINTTDVETTVNGQTYNDEVILGAEATLKVPATKSIVFVKTVTGNHTLKTNQTVTFNDTVEIGALETQAANINSSSIKTLTGGQTYQGAVQIQKETELNSAGAIQFASTLNGNQKITLTAGSNNITFGGLVGTLAIPLAAMQLTSSGTTEFSAAAYITTFTDTANSGNITFKQGGAITTITSGILNTNGTVTLGTSGTTPGPTLTINCDLTHNAGPTKIYGTLTAADENLTFGVTDITGTINCELLTLGKTTGGDMIINAQAKLINDFESDGTVSFTENALLCAPAASVFGKPDKTINITGNLIIVHGAALTINAGLVTADNIIIFKGSITAKGNLTAARDFVVLGSSYDSLDSTTGITDEYAYNAARPAGWFTAQYNLAQALPDTIAAPALNNTLSGSLTVSAGKILRAGKNFYANGASLTGTNEWFIDILSNTVPVSGDNKYIFAEAYNCTFTNCTVRKHTGTSAEGTEDDENAQLAVENCGTLTGCKHFDSSEFVISHSWTTRDNVVYVEFNRKARNKQGELNAEISQFKYFFTADNDTSYISIATNEAGSLVLANGTETDKIYLVAATDKTWNTDATGKAAGDSASTDHNGTHRSSKPYIDIPRALQNSGNTTAEQNAVITDRFGKRLKNYSTRTPTAQKAYGTDDGAQPTYVLDHTGPVLVKVRTGQETHETNLTTQQAYDSHNFIEFIYSEPVNFGNPANTMNTAGWIPAHTTETSATLNTVQNIQITDGSTGSASSTGSSNLVFAGLNQTIATGKILTKQAETVTQNVNALYRDNTHSIKYSVAGYAANVNTSGAITGSYINWTGYIEEAVLPQGAVTTSATAAAPNALITDCATDNYELTGTHLYNAQIMNKPGLTVDNSIQSGTSYGPWDTQAPVFMQSHLKGNDDDELYFEAIGNGDGSTLNRIEIHIADNPSGEDSYNKIWLTRFGWSESTDAAAPITGAEAADNLVGGSRPYAALNKTLGGIRYCTIQNQETAFRYETGNSNSPSQLFTAIAPGASAPFFTSSLAARNEIPTESDNTYIKLNLSDTSLPYKTTFTLSYNETGSYITDLAGNRLKSAGLMKTVDRTSPDFKIAFAPVKSKKLLVIFVKKLTTSIKYNGTDISEGFGTIFPYCFEIGTIDAGGAFTANSGSNLMIDTSVPARIIQKSSNDYYTAVELTLTKQTSFEDVKNLYIRLKNAGTVGASSYALTSKDPITGLDNSYVTFVQDAVGNYMQMYQAHALSDFASGIVTPLYAYNDDLEFNDENIMQNLYQEQSWAVHDWNEEQQNYGSLIAQKPVTVIASTSGVTDLKLRLFYTDAPVAGSKSGKFNSDIPQNKIRLWMPQITGAGFKDDGLFPAYADVTNTNFDFIDSSAFSSADISEGLEFNFGQTIAQNFTGGKQISFLFGVLDSSGTNLESVCINPVLAFSAGTASYNTSGKVPLYCIRLKNPGDITSMDLWSFRLKNINLQRGDITVLNNVIDSQKGEKVILRVNLEQDTNLTILVMTLDGNIVDYLNRGKTEKGEHYYSWNGSNRNGTPVARGMYFIRITADGLDETRKVMVVKE